MHDPTAVRVTERARHLRQPHLHHGNRHRPVLANHGFEGRTGHKLHHEILHLVGFLDRINRDDVGVVERRHGDRFAVEALDHAGGEHQTRRHHLDRDAAVELDLAGEDYRSHAAVAERAANLVLVADRGPEVVEDAVPGRSAGLFDRRPDDFVLDGAAMGAKTVTSEEAAAALPTGRLRQGDLRWQRGLTYT